MPVYHLSATEDIPITTGSNNGFAVTAHNGHTTKLQFIDADGTPEDLEDPSGVIDHTAPHSGTLSNYPGSVVRVHIAGGTGDIIFEVNPEPIR